MTSRAIRALVALDAGADTELVKANLPAGPALQVTEMNDPRRTSFERMSARSVDVLVVACGPESEDAVAVVGGAVAEWPDRPVVVLCESSQNGFVQRIFDAGADDIVLLPARGQQPIPSEVLFTLQKAIARKPTPGAAGSTEGTMVCVLGPKGGIGKTLTSCNLAVALAQGGANVILIDLDLQFGDLGLSLNLTPHKTIYDLAISGGSLDAEKVDAYLQTHASGVRVLLAPSRPDQAGAITAGFLHDLYAVLRATSTYTVIDTPPGFTPEVIASIDASTHICMVGMLDALSLKNTKLGLETLELMGYDQDRVRMVLNRADSNVGITHNDVVSVLGRPPDVMVPSHRDIPRSVNEGTPITMSGKRSEAAKAFNSLADIYRATQAKPATKRHIRSPLTRKRG